MKDDGKPHPVELLRDQRGVYGIGVSELFDFELTAARCGIEPEPYTYERPPPDLILRPDWFVDTKPHRAVLQKITGGFRRGPFMRTNEEQLRQFIHHTALNRAELPWPPPQQNNLRWWSEDTKKQAHNRGIYHGLRQLSLVVINHLIGQALEAAADADAIKAARRFTFEHRENIYRAGALSRRALQLTETFPVLALAIFSNYSRFESWPLCADNFTSDWKALEAKRVDLAARKSTAAHLVDRGVRLRDVAAVMNIPMTLRHVKPGVAHLASSTLCWHPEFLSFMLDTTPRQRIWLLVVNWAFNKIGANFGAWVAKHASQIPGRHDQEVGSFLSDLADWVRAGDAGWPAAGREFVVRPFAPSMSLKTVTKLSADWHEAVASNLAEGPNAAFPPPWLPAAKISDYEIIPITTASCPSSNALGQSAVFGTEALARLVEIRRLSTDVAIVAV
jgi:hypothetical protein